MSERDLSDFDVHLCDLFIVLRDVILAHEKSNISLTNRKNPVLTRLESYIKIYDDTEPEEHVWSFDNIYTKNKNKIMRGHNRGDLWLKDGKLVIQFGEDVGITNNIKIHLSVIYVTACKIRDEAEENMDGLPDVDQEAEMLYPSLVLYYMYKIFSEIAPKKTDRKKLANFASDLAIDAGIKTARKNNSSNPLGGIMESIPGMMEQFGIKMPDGKMPDPENISNMLGKVMDNPNIKSTIGNAFQEIQECNNINEMAGKLMGALGGLAGNKSITDMLGGGSGGSSGGSSGENNNGDTTIECCDISGGDGGDYEDEFGDYE